MILDVRCMLMLAEGKGSIAKVNQSLGLMKCCAAAAVVASSSARVQPFSTQTPRTFTPSRASCVCRVHGQECISRLLPQMFMPHSTRAFFGPIVANFNEKAVFCSGGRFWICFSPGAAIIVASAPYARLPISAAGIVGQQQHRHLARVHKRTRASHRPDPGSMHKTIAAQHRPGGHGHASRAPGQRTGAAVWLATVIPAAGPGPPAP